MLDCFGSGHGERREGIRGEWVFITGKLIIRRVAFAMTDKEK